MTERGFGSLTAASAAILFGASNVATVFLLRSFTPVGGALWRAVVAALLLVGFWLIQRALASPRDPSHASGQPPDMASRLARGLLIGLCGGPLFLVGLNLAVAGTGATVTAFVSGLYAVFAAVLAPVILAEPLRRRVVIGFVCALAGCAMLSELTPEPAFTAGFVAALAAAVVYALYLVLGRRWSGPYRLEPIHLTGATVGTSIVSLAAWIAIVDPSTAALGEPRPEAFGALLFMALTLAAGQTLVMASVRRIQAARTAAFLLLNPVTATALAALLLGERLSAIQLAGAVLVLAGMSISIGLDRLVRPAAPTVQPRP